LNIGPVTFQVETMRLQVQRIRVREQFGEILRDALATLPGNADIDAHGGFLVVVCTDRNARRDRREIKLANRCVRPR
jgi:hypothetical protein